MNKEALYQRIEQLSPSQRNILTNLLSKRESNKIPPKAAKHLVAYVVGKGQLDVTDLQNYLSKRLPDYMTPATIVQLNELPKLPNGKLNLRALPEIESFQYSSSPETTQPFNQIEQLLIEIWQQVLDVHPVSVNDNFFEIGGDSILSIQIVALARKSGLILAPNQLFEHQTIASLSKVVEREENTVPQINPSPETIFMTPIQRWFFEEHVAAPHYWNQGMIFELSDKITPDIVQKSLEQLVIRHEALRLSFVSKDEQWEMNVQEPRSLDFFQFNELSNLSDKLPINDISKYLKRVQENLEMEKGGLFRGVYFACGKGHSNQLALFAHHLTVDAISWEILIKELSDLIESFINQTESSLPELTSPFTAWSYHLSEYAKTDLIKRDLSFWQTQNKILPSFPVDFEIALPVTEGTTETIYSELAQVESIRLVNEVPRAYGTRTHEVLITALAFSLFKWQNITEFCLGIERHGREMDHSDLDLSRSIGWFTTYFPVILKTDNVEDLGIALTSIKEQLRKVPHAGLSYGVLRYLNDDKTLTQRPSVLFNFLGNKKAMSPGILGAGTVIENSRDLSSERFYNLEINCFIEDEKLISNWRFSRDQYRPDTIEQLTQSFKVNLLELISHCATIERQQYTPSDFPDVDLSQDDLNNLLDQV